MSRTFFYDGNNLPLVSILAKMREAGVSEEQITKFTSFLNPMIHRTSDHSTQRFFINQALMAVIGLYPENTITVRTYLISDGDLFAWARLFEDGVLPCMIRNNTQPKIS